MQLLVLPEAKNGPLSDQAIEWGSSAPVRMPPSQGITATTRHSAAVRMAEDAYEWRRSPPVSDTAI
jgi:hypothetical protein